MPIFRSARLYLTAYGVQHIICWLVTWGAGMQAVRNVLRMLLESNNILHTVRTACFLAPRDTRQHMKC